MPTVSISPIFNGWQGFSPAGLPLTLGQVYTYQAGTNTPLSTYTTNSGATPNSNPIQLDAGGRPPQEIWLDDSAAYKFVLQDALGTTLGTYENISGGGAGLGTLRADLANTSSASKGAGLSGFTYALNYAAGTVGRWLNDLSLSTGSGFIGWIQAGTGAVLRTVYARLRDTVHVTDFGAVADGNSSTGSGTDNTAAFQAAITYAQANSLSVYIPAGVYVIGSQLTVGSNVRLYGAGMYRTYLIAKNTFVSDGVLWANGAGGPPTVIEHMCVLGQTSTGAGAGSTGIRASANAVILRHLWVGGFAAQYKLDGTDQHASDCWADVSLASGYGFIVSNGSNHLTDCTTFNCYTGMLIDGSGTWPTTEPDIGVQVTGCNIIQSGYSGISIVSGVNVTVADTEIHSPTAASKFTRDFITVTDGSNITLSNVMGTFGTSVSTTCVGIRQTGQTQGLNVIGCNIVGADYGYQITNAPFANISGNAARSCRTWGFRVFGDSAGMSMTGNQSSFNGTTSATDGGGYWLSNSSGSGKWNVTGNSAGDFGTTSKYGFYVDANASAAAKISLGLNTTTNTTTAYTIVGTPANVTQTANI